VRPLLLAAVLIGCSAQPPQGTLVGSQFKAETPTTVTFSEMRIHCRLIRCFDENGILLKHDPPTDADIESRCRLPGWKCIPP
jgi:hypothetical protein